VQSLRARFAAADLYGTRVAIHHGQPATFPFPPYLASLMICPDVRALPDDPEFPARMVNSLRPYGGTACFPTDEACRALVERLRGLKLPGVMIDESSGLVRVARVGALPGAANWTHEHADAANTRVSKDKLVKAPLGLLWFGGPSHDGILPRHGHGPQPQVIDGRALIEGVDLLRALDIYTGRLLWETKIPGVGRFYNNLAHQPGANASGGNFVSTSDGIYIFVDRRCLRLDPNTGKCLREFTLPPLEGTTDLPRWGYVNVDGNYLVAGAEPLLDPKTAERLSAQLPEPAEIDEKDNDGAPVKSKSLDKVLKLVKGFNDNMSASRRLVVMNRYTGQVLWSQSARYAFRHNAICIGNGRIYAIDRLSGDQLKRFRLSVDELAHPHRLRVFDLATGKELWSSADEIFGTWLSYSAKHDVIVEAGRVARDTLMDEPRGMRAYDAKTGKVLWFEKEYTGPAMIHGDTILQGQGACDLLTGAVKKRVDPITGELVPWTWARNYGCNTPCASEHLLTFRSGAAGYFDLCNDGGTGNFGGFRSSCTNNLIVAGGVITAPEYTRTCTCAYQNQTSVGLIHMPEAEIWTFFGTKELTGAIKQVGISFAAPGDRKGPDDILWLEYPMTSGLSPAVSVATEPKNPRQFRRHSSQVCGPLPWVASSGFLGIEEVNILLSKERPSHRYTVRLVFMEPKQLGAGQRLFDVAIESRTVLTGFDIVKEAGAPLRSVVKEFVGVTTDDGTLTIRLTPTPLASVRETILCGVAVIAEK
ncbi:MAG: malectin domain-containing carbohydrate-binding protein, partial [Gemmataceae bacterium]|nr:malectin domain-containing carbohydrate-binding protein [Gemmataceae bacterium]